jgi:hypothetical protein
MLTANPGICPSTLRVNRLGFNLTNTRKHVYTNWLSIIKGMIGIGAWKAGSSPQTARTVAQDSVPRGEGGQKRQPQAAEILES